MPISSGQDRHHRTADGGRAQGLTRVRRETSQGPQFGNAESAGGLDGRSMAAGAPVLGPSDSPCTRRDLRVHHLGWWVGEDGVAMVAGLDRLEQGACRMLLAARCSCNECEHDDRQVRDVRRPDRRVTQIPIPIVIAAGRCSVWRARSIVALDRSSRSRLRRRGGRRWVPACWWPLGLWPRCSG